MGLVVAAGMTVNSAHADDDIFRIGKKTYGCNLLTGSNVFANASPGTVYQTVGESSLNGRSKGHMVRYKCVSPSAFQNDYWAVVETKWCSDSDVKQTGVAGVEYMLIGPDGTNYGSDGAAISGGCVKGVKKSGGSDSSSRSNNSGGEGTSFRALKSVLSGNTSDSIMNACYATRKCGAKGFYGSQHFSAATAAVGAVAGGSLGMVFGPVGQAMSIASGAYAGYVVGQNLGGTIGYGADEYIYFDDGTCLECDTHQMGEHYECPNGTIASNGTNFFRCRTTASNDRWESISPLPICARSPIQNKDVKNSKIEIKAVIDKRVSAGVSVYSGDACFYISCGDGVLNETQTECVAKVPDNGGGNGGGNASCPEGSSNAFITHESCIGRGTFECTRYATDGIQCLCGMCKPAPEKPQGSSLDRCLKSRSTAEGKACCYLPNKVATWTNNACTCVGDSMEFKIGPDGRGTCNAKAPEVGEKFECDASILATMQTWAKECATKKPSVVSMVSTIAALCVSDDRTYEKFNTQYSTLLALNPGDCAEVVDDSDEIHNDVSVAQTAISEAVASLDSITSGLEVSKWKDEEGKFNTARLASDSIAGVVLGTAGGLITSSVVKKSQVEDGFEDMSCVIGGQTVANWGDEFTVGVQ